MANNERAKVNASEFNTAFNMSYEKKVRLVAVFIYELFGCF